VRTDQRVRCFSADRRIYHLKTAPFMNNGANFIVGGEHGDAEINMPRPESLPISVISDLHPWMQSYWVVTDHPYVAVSDKEGRFRIEGLPVGEHSFSVWQEQAGSIDRKWTVQVRSKESQTLPAVKVPISRFKTPG
jgi:hypothetical protein